MGIVRAIPEIEAWLDRDANSWSVLSDPEYRSLVRRWLARYAPMVRACARSLQGNRAVISLQARLPADVYILSGLAVPLLANNGGRGPAAFMANDLWAVPRDEANSWELIVVAKDFAWSCIFSHEAGTFVWEQLYESETADRTGADPA